MQKKRRFNRVPLNVMAEIIIAGNCLLADEIRNLSLGGCLLPLKADFEIKTPCRINIFMNGTSSELKVFVTGRVMRCEKDEMAIQFTDIDPDSLFHLQNIIRYNSPDPEMPGNELFDHRHVST